LFQVFSRSPAAVPRSLHLKLINRLIKIGAMSARSRQKRPRSRPPGRPPAGAPDLRQKLLDAARALFIAKGFGNVGTRELARAAGVSPAMIPYYFGDKQGLYDALIDDAIGRVLGRLQRLAAAPKSAPTEDPIDAFLSVYLATLIAEPWIPQLLVREVLAHDSPFRRRFREHFATPARAALGALLRGEQERGTLRPDLDLELTTLSLVGMTAFPFLVHPVLGEVFGYRLDPEFRDRFHQHTRRLFLDGARPRSAP
jgi:TetR/AcrR family transcriptional regulator